MNRWHVVAKRHVAIPPTLLFMPASRTARVQLCTGGWTALFMQTPDVAHMAWDLQIPSSVPWDFQLALPVSALVEDSCQFHLFALFRRGGSFHNTEHQSVTLKLAIAIWSHLPLLPLCLSWEANRFFSLLWSMGVLSYISSESSSSSKHFLVP